MASCLIEPLARLSMTFNNLDLMLQETTATLKSGQVTGQTLTSLQACTVRLFHLNDTICHDLNSHETGWGEHCKDLQATAECKRAVASREACIASTAVHMAEASTQLQRMAAMSESELCESAEKELFLLLWTSTGTICKWPMQYIFKSMPLLPATTNDLSTWVPMFANFNAWLLSFIRQPSAGMDLLKSRSRISGMEGQLASDLGVCTENSRIADWREPLFRCLQLTTLHLWNLCLIPDVQLCATVKHFPENFISILCCLACELFPFRGVSNEGKESSNSDQPDLCAEHRKCLGTLTGVVGRAINVQARIQAGALIHSELTSDAVLEVIKLVISCFAKDLSGSVDMYCMHLESLDIIMASRGARLSKMGICSSEDVGTAALGKLGLEHLEQGSSISINSQAPQPLSLSCLNARASCVISDSSYVPRILTLESRILPTLLALSAANPRYLEVSSSIMESAQRTWAVLSVLPGRDDAEILACLPFLIQHCLLHLARVLPEAQFRVMYLAIFTKKTEEFEQALLLPVKPVQMGKLKLLLLSSMFSVVNRVCAEPAVALQLQDGQVQNLEGRAPFERKSPVWGPLDAFHWLPDCLLLLELAMRQGNEIQILDNAILGCRVASAHLLIQMTCMSKDTFLDHRSLFATINKVLQLAATTCKLLCREAVSNDQALLDGARRSLAAALMSLLARYTSSLNTNNASDGECLKRDTSAGGVDQQATSSGGFGELNALTTGSRLELSFDEWNFEQWDSKVSSGHTYCCSNTGSHAHSVSASPDAIPLRSLATMLVMALIRLSEPPSRQEEKKPGELGRLKLIVPSAGWVEKLLERDAALGGVAVAQLISLSKVEEEPATALVQKNAMRLGSKQWEKFASQHLRGRLLPGCCHMDCINLVGISEVMLPMRGCAGCRQARYCSVECQTAAWRQGGHSQVCKKGS